MAEPDEGEDRRHHADAHDEQDGDDDGAEREAERDQVQPDEAALLRLVIGDVHRLEERLDAVIGAPKRQRQAEDEAEAERRLVLRGEALQLRPDEIDAARGQEAAEEGDMVGDRHRVGDEPVDRHEGGERREEREQQVECRARGDQRDAVLAELGPDAPENVLPALPAEFGRAKGAPAAPGFQPCVDRRHGCHRLSSIMAENRRECGKVPVQTRGAKALTMCCV